MRITTIRRALPISLAAAGLFLGATACGGDKVDKGALVSKIKGDSSFSPALTDPQASCVADVVIKYVDKDAVNTYIKTGKDLPEPKKDKDKATTELQGCIKK